jgi:PAS domain-containing protein
VHTTEALAQLLSSVGDAVVVSDETGAITLWNPAATYLFDFNEDRALRKRLAELESQQVAK